MAFSGSLRKDSYNSQLLDQAVRLAKAMGASVTLVDLKDYPMPFYDGDLETTQGMPKMAKKFRDMMIASDEIIIASPEYNGSISAVLKNAIDWASRTEDGKASKEAFKGKKFAIMSASPGQLGGATGLNHLRTILVRLGGEVVEKQVSIGSAHTYFNGKDIADSAPLKEEIQELFVK